MENSKENKHVHHIGAERFTRRSPLGAVASQRGGNIAADQWGILFLILATNLSNFALSESSL